MEESASARRTGHRRGHLKSAETRLVSGDAASSSSSGRSSNSSAGSRLSSTSSWKTGPEHSAVLDGALFPGGFDQILLPGRYREAQDQARSGADGISRLREASLSGGDPRRLIRAKKAGVRLLPRPGPCRPGLTRRSAQSTKSGLMNAGTISDKVPDGQSQARHLLREVAGGAVDKKVVPRVRQPPWTHHLILLRRTRLSVERELNRQIRTGAALRILPATKKVSPAVAQVHRTAADEFETAYSPEFLGLAQDHAEPDLHGALLRNLGRFINELGRDFCFGGSEYSVQVGNQDFAIDLVFCA